jgi:hypothetical protein
MNGLLESIARRRRASTSNGTPPVPHLNGSSPGGEPSPRETASAAVGRPSPSSPAGFLQRGRLRRRARYLRQLRELQLRDLGGFLVELHRLGRQRPELVGEKIAAAAATDAELRGLDDLLGADESVRRAGIGGACSACGAIYGSRDRFCASCGKAVTGE